MLSTLRTLSIMALSNVGGVSRFFVHTLLLLDPPFKSKKYDYSAKYQG